MGTNTYHRAPLSMGVVNIGPLLTTDQQVALYKSFTNQEIKLAIFSIPNHKSPGPDSYSNGFFKHTWSQTGPMVCEAVKEFFRTGYMPRYLSATKLIILPKVLHPQTATEFRPISCCNVLYKCISKLICLRLKEVLPHLIDPSQAAFVPGRELLYNVLISQDIVRGYNRKSISPRCLLKIDLHKAFDSIHWDFLKELLHALKFPPFSLNGFWLMSPQWIFSFI